MKSKIIKLEEFLDENIDIKKNKNRNKNKNKNKHIIDDILSINSENEPNIELSIIKKKKNKILRISVEMFIEGEILNFDLDIDKDTFFELVKEME